VAGATADADDTADKDWIDVRLSLDPPFDTNEIGDPHVFTGTLEYDDGSGWSPLAGETIDFVITSGPGDLNVDSDTTDANGEASVTLNSSATGTTTVEASFDGTVAGATADADDTADKDWVKTDITIDKTVTDVGGDGPAGTVDKADDVISYRIVVGNAGTRDLTGISVSDPLLGTLTGPSGDAGGDGVLGVGESWTYTGSYTVLQSDIDSNGIDSDGAADNDGDIDNTATVSSNELPDESDSEAVQISVGPNYTIDKTVTDVGGDGPAGAVDEAGDVISYRIVVENIGNVSLTGVSVSDPLLDPLSGPTGDDGDGVLDVGESWTYTGSYTALQSDIDDNGGGDGDIDNTATVSSNELPDESDSEDVPLSRNPSIGIVKTGDAGPVNAGQTIQYSITVTNTGNVTLHNVTLNDAKLGLSQNLGTLDPGDSATVTPTYATSEADLPGPVVNTAIADSDETGPANDSHSVDVLGGPALAIVKTGPGEVLVGETIAYTITVTNVGDVTLHNVGVSDAKLGLINVPVGDLAPGASATVTPAPTYGPTTEADVPRVDNTASADSDETDPISDDHSVVVRRPLADLIVEKIVDDPFTTEGATVAFTVTVTNGGPDTATGVALQDVLPLGLLYVSDNGGGDYSEVTDRWTVGTLPVGSSASLRISALVDEGTLGTTITNTALVIETDIEDPDESNNEDSADVTVIAADLAVVKTVDNPTPAEGDSIVWTITVLNNGPDDATGIVISDVLPDGLIYVDDDGAGSYNEASGDWIIALLPIAGSRTLHITAETEAGTAGQTIVNVASIEESDLPDPNPANDEDDDEITVTEGVAGGGGSVECEEKVIISEIAWAGTAAGPEDEWIELRNIGSEPIDLNGWVLRWRKKEPVSPEDFRWKVVPLSGVLAPAAQSACELAENDPIPSIEFIERDDGLSWRVVARPVDLDESYLLLERGSDFTVLNLDADIVYDDVEPYEMELSNEGDIIELLDADGQVVDTANAFDSFGGGWPAGNARTFATMERTDPLGPDEPENWHTNLGIVTRGVDANGRPLVATSDVINSQTLEEMELFADLRPTITMAGTPLEVGLDLPRSERAQTGWPWIRVTQPTTVGSPGVAGAGGGVSPVFSFSSRYEGDLYLLGIDTAGLPAGDYLVWVVYGEGEIVLVPITVR